MYYGEFSSLSKEFRDLNNPELDVYIKNIYDEECTFFHFPVNPIDTININRGKKFETVDLINFGEADFSSPGKKIKELSFSTLLPSKADSYCKYLHIRKPEEIIKKLEQWMEQKEPIRLIITRLNINELVIISDIGEEIRAGEHDDKYISITFRIYREPKIESLPVAKKSSSPAQKVQLRNNRPNTNTKYRAGQWVVTTASVLRVREKPGTNSKILGRVRKGAKYKIGRVQGNWADIYWGKSGGWICLDYVK
ncbi:SH3 domain-containing protein [Clostridium novyi]|uniref:SH3 domain-containing protein n=1 Tax=Clostridium novyi TaxID=1542 RepID=UPI0004DA46C7|nr:SH3 domain-containing protein [Clostridium novyi]KEH84603.1 hypothetical protein Z966_p0058 [Clostridium novyi A str. NCTC 538]